jgi:phosphoribosylaminoimidazole-succinocarboxamide synthase
MVQTANTDLKLLYEGSVKRVYAPPNDGHHLWFYFTDDYSVFDWGKMPDTIAKKGLALTLLGAYFFEQLEKKGIRTHYERLVSAEGKTLTLVEAAKQQDRVFLEVRKAEVYRPDALTVFGQPLYAYPLVPATSRLRLVPLEVVFRFGMPAGSSLRARLEKDPTYLQQLGLTDMPGEDGKFSQPVIEFFTKLEPKDRLLSLSEAIAISCLRPEQFQRLCKITVEAAEAVKEIFQSKGIELWDGKFEFVIDNNGEILLADSVGPDELRLLYKGVHLSKEIIRLHYRDSEWEKSLKKAQDIARQKGREDWKEICINDLGQQPEPLPRQFKEQVDHLYGALTNRVCGEQLLESEPDLESLVQSLPRK